MQHHAKLSICTTGSFQHTKRNLVRYSKPTSITQKGPARVTSCGPLDACDTGTSCAAGPAGRLRADRLEPRTQTGTQGISPCGSYGAICAQPATPPIAIGAGSSDGPAARALRRAVPRRPSGAATAQPRAADRRAALRYPSRGVARNAARGAATSPKTQKARRGRSPRGPLSAHIEKRPPRARPQRRGSPGPIPNPAVKPAFAESTAARGCGRAGRRARGGRFSFCAQGRHRRPGRSHRARCERPAGGCCPCGPLCVLGDA